MNVYARINIGTASFNQEIIFILGNYLASLSLCHVSYTALSFFLLTNGRPQLKVTSLLNFPNKARSNSKKYRFNIRSRQDLVRSPLRSATVPNAKVVLVGLIPTWGRIYFYNCTLVKKQNCAMCNVSS